MKVGTRLIGLAAACVLVGGIAGPAAVSAAQIARAELRLPPSGDHEAVRLEVVGLGSWSKPQSFADGFESGDVAAFLKSAGGKVTLLFGASSSVCTRFENQAGWRGHVYRSAQLLFKAPDGGAVMSVVLDKAKPFAVKCDVHPWMTSIMFETFRVEPGS